MLSQKYKNAIISRVIECFSMYDTESYETRKNAAKMILYIINENFKSINAYNSQILVGDIVEIIYDLSCHRLANGTKWQILKYNHTGDCGDVFDLHDTYMLVNRKEIKLYSRNGIEL
jgi:hypothetical protein